MAISGFEQGNYIVTHNEWETVKSLFFEVMDQPEPAAILANRPNLDDHIKQQVLELVVLQGELHDKSFLEGNALAFLPSEPAAEERHPWEGKVIGAYRIGSHLGSGGMGDVYRAQQLQPIRRWVAIKFLRTGPVSGRMLPYFEREKQALAILEHHHIAKIFDVGMADQIPFIAMEYVQGTPIDTYCEAKLTQVRPIIELFLKVCDGVAHAHQKGVIHRDLKPANVLVDPRGEPKIIDFGLSKMIVSPWGEVPRSQTEWVVGTPLYMSPEQARVISDSVDVRTDVYALGMMLYRLLTGSFPFDETLLKQAPMDGYRDLFDREWSRPSEKMAERVGVRSKGTDVRAVRNELDWVVMKALAKEPERRYDSVAEFSDDLKRFLNGEPLKARPPSLTYRLGKLVRRNRFATTLILMVPALLLAGLVGLSSGLQRSRAAEALAKSEADSLAYTLSQVGDIFRSVDPSAQGRDVTMLEVLDDYGRRMANHGQERPKIQGALHHFLAEGYMSLGMAEQALSHARKAVAIRGETYPEHSLPILESEFLLSMAEVEYENVAEGINQFRSVKTKFEAHYGTENPLFWEMARWDATLDFRFGNYEQAERKFHHLYKHWQGQDRDSGERLVAERGYAIVLGAIGRHDESMEILTGVLKKEAALFGADDSRLFSSRFHLARSLFYDGQFRPAVTLMEVLVPVFEDHYGESHQNTLTTIEYLSLSLIQIGQFEQAETYLLDALEKRLDHLPWSHDYVAVTRNRIGWLYQTRGEHVFADQNYGPLVKEMLARGEPWNLFDGSLVLSHAANLFCLERYSDSQKELQRILQPNEPNAALEPWQESASTLLAMVYLRMGEPQKGRDHFTRLPAIANSRPDTDLLRAMFLMESSRGEEALPFLCRTTRRREGPLPCAGLGLLWLCQMQTRREEEAAVTYRHWLDECIWRGTDQSWLAGQLVRMMDMGKVDQATRKAFTQWQAEMARLGQLDNGHHD